MRRRLVRLPRFRLPRLRLRLPRSRRSRAGLLGLALLLGFWFLSSGNGRQTWPRQQILDAIRHVESGNRGVVPDGDGGLAIGPYQIHEVYWQDAVRFRPELGGSYQDCRHRAYAERVLAAYMEKWVPDAWRRGEAETIARVHNGGPNGPQNPKTDGYWSRVRGQLP